MNNNENTGTYPWGHDRRFNAYSNYFKNLFGGRVQKVSIDAGFTCPNRDGTAGEGGCTFCNNDAFNPSYCTPNKSISSQIGHGIKFHKKRYRRSVGYLAYFQAYSNTYASLDRLKELYTEALSFPGIIGLVIGTRPDCVNEKILDYLSQLSKDAYVTVEYGVESCYDKTLERINRGHDFQTSVSAIKLTSERGIHTGAHFIFGLPGETREDMMKEAAMISELPLTTVKFHQLQIIRGTALEKDYRANPEIFNLFTWEEYQDFLIGFLERLNPALVVERFTSEAPPDLIVSPRWGKKRAEGLMTMFENRMEELDTWQGRKFEQ